MLKPGGTFIFSAPMGTSYILRGARDLGEGHMKIVNDPLRGSQRKRPEEVRS